MAEFVTSSDFVAHLQTVFHVETPIALELELLEVRDRSNAHIEQFSVFFSGPESPFLKQGIYTLKHAEMLDLEIFLVPLGPKNARMAYEAVFSRLRSGMQPVG